MVGELASDNRVSKCLHVTADWAMALQGHGDLTEVLDFLRRLSRADVGILIRANCARSEQFIAISDPGSGRVWHTPARSCAQIIVGENRPRLRVGAIWRLSDARQDAVGDAKTEMTSFSKQNMFRDVVAISLQNEGSQSDFLEFHYCKTPTQDSLEIVTVLANALADCWRRRVNGVITRRLVRTRLREVRSNLSETPLSILDFQNPAQLSRCEFRICLLLSEGMTAKKIAEELSISQATVRSHLSSIFSKTGKNSQVELLSEINRDRSPHRSKSVRLPAAHSGHRATA